MIKILGRVLIGLAVLFGVTGLVFIYCGIIGIGPDYMGELALLHVMLTFITGFFASFIVCEF